MLKIVVIIAAILGVAVVAVLIVASTKPDTFRVVRTATIKAPPDKVFALIADFRRWTEWSPWEKKDPNLKRDYGGAAGSVGQTYAWDGDKNVGAGSMIFTEVQAPEKIALKLDFSRPFEAHNTVVFSLVPQGDGTAVTWDMQGPAPLLAKVIHVFIDMDKMVGKDFETGLANLKAAAEKQG